MLDAQEYRVSVCICTKDRPDALIGAVDSVLRSRVEVYEIIVSDDSSSNKTQQLLRRDYPSIRYVQGPRRGLGANRNRAVSQVTGTHVLFLDDDAALRQDFLSQVIALLRTVDPSGDLKIIVSGLESIDGLLIYPSDLGFLGYMDRPRSSASTNPLRTSVINATLFPVSLFRSLGFDENLIYGSDESDFTARATSIGYRIVLNASAVNEHFQSALHRQKYSAFTQASRLYTTFKLYYFIDRCRFKGLSYIPVACAHLALHGLKRRGVIGLLDALKAIKKAASYLRSYISKPTDRPALGAPIDDQLTSSR